MEKNNWKIMTELPTVISCELPSEDAVLFKENVVNNEANSCGKENNKNGILKNSKYKETATITDFQSGEFYKRIKKVIDDAH
jgi:hypothetical protein